MKEKIVNPLSIKEALELSEEMRKSIIPITGYWENDINHETLNRLPLAVRMPKGLVTQAEEERRRGRYGYFCDLTPCGSDAPYFPDMILEPIEKFDATHFPDGREKNKAVYHMVTALSFRLHTKANDNVSCLHGKRCSPDFHKLPSQTILLDKPYVRL